MGDQKSMRLAWSHHDKLTGDSAGRPTTWCGGRELKPRRPYSTDRGKARLLLLLLLLLLPL